MRFAIRTIPLCAALCVALVSIVPPSSVEAQEIRLLDATPGNSHLGDLKASPAPSSHDVATENDFTLDDQMLSRQRGGATGMLMVATTPRLAHGGSVTLWDEIAPPAPLPVPVDASRPVQGNVAALTRK